MIVRPKIVNGKLVEFIVDGVDQLGRETLPSVAAMGKSVATAFRAIINHGGKKVSEEERKRRIAICKACPFYIPLIKVRQTSIGHCAKCGCYLALKTILEAWHCPIQKW